MKKYFFLAAAAMALLASCTKTDLVTTDNDLHEISFENFVHKTTKAASVETSTLQTNGFRVSAYYNGTPGWYFKNLDVTYADSKYSTKYYWPNSSSTMDFYAVYPKSFSISDSKTFEYDNTAAMTDIVTAVKTGESCAGHVSAANPVALTFNHILTQIYFSANTANADYYCKVSKIEVITNGKATYTFGTGFGEVSESKTYDYVSLASGSEQKIEYNATTPTLVGTDIATNSLMVIPQDGGTADIATIKVYYKSYNTVGDAVINDFSGADTCKSFTVKKWSPKQSVNYVMTLPVGSQPIEFIATVSAWDTTTDTAISL